MRVRTLRLYQALRLLADAIAVACAWRLTIDIRILLNSLTSQQVTVEEATFWAPSLLLVLALWSLLAWRLGHYGAPAQKGWHKNLLSIVEQSLLASIVVVSITAFDRSIGVQASRAFMLIFLPTSLLTLALARFGTLLLCLKTESLSPSPVRAALLGDCEVAAHLLRKMSPLPGKNIFQGLDRSRRAICDWSSRYSAHPRKHHTTCRSDQPRANYPSHHVEQLYASRRSRAVRNGVQTDGHAHELCL